MKVGDTFFIKNINDDAKRVLLLYRYDLHDELDVQKYIADYILLDGPDANFGTYDRFFREQEIPNILKKYCGISWLYMSGDTKCLVTHEALMMRRFAYDMI